jgi:hypothetical protein
MTPFCWAIYSFHLNECLYKSDNVLHEMYVYVDRDHGDKVISSLYRGLLLLPGGLLGIFVSVFAFAYNLGRWLLNVIKLMPSYLCCCCIGRR